MAQETQTLIVKRCEHDEFEVQVPLYLTGDEARDAALRLAERYRNAHMVNLLNEGVVLLARSKTWTAGPTEGKAGE